MFIKLDMPVASPDLASAWAPFVADAKAPWDLSRVVHLHRRAGFAASWDKLRRDLNDGPEASINRMLEGKARSGGVPEEFQSTPTFLADAAAASNDPARPNAGGAHRMT